MPPRRILITGSEGFVGQHLLPALTGLLPEAALFTDRIEITDAAAVDRAIACIRPEAVVHLAAIAAVTAARGDPALAWAVNLQGTLNVGGAILRHAPSCALLFAASADAYGGSFRAGVALDETAPLAPLTLYGATKAAADLGLGAMAEEGLRVIRLRPFNHTGAGQSPAFMVPAFARQLARIAMGLQAPVLKVGALHPHRDFLDVADVCTAYARAVACADALAPGSILNIASGTPRQVGAVLRQMMEIAGVEAEIVIDPARLRAGDIACATGDAARARAALGWAPAIPWAQTLGTVIEDWRRRCAAGEAE